MDTLAQKYQIVESWKARASKVRKCVECGKVFPTPKYAWNKRFCSERCWLNRKHKLQKIRRRNQRERLAYNDRFKYPLISKCPECGNGNLIVDFNIEEFVCSNCGLVISDNSTM